MEEKGQRDVIHVLKYLMGANEDTARLFSVVPWDSMRGSRPNVKSKFLLNVRKHIGQTPEQVSQDSLHVSILGDVQNPAGRVPGQPALGGLA